MISPPARKRRSAAPARRSRRRMRERGVLAPGLRRGRHRHAIGKTSSGPSWRAARSRCASTWPRRDGPGFGRHARRRVEGAYAIEMQHLAPRRDGAGQPLFRLALRRPHRDPAGAGHARAPRRPALDRAGAPPRSRKSPQTIGPFEDASLGRSIARLGALVRGRVTRA